MSLLPPTPLHQAQSLRLRACLSTRPHLLRLPQNLLRAENHCRPTSSPRGHQRHRDLRRIKRRQGKEKRKSMSVAGAQALGTSYLSALETWQLFFHLAPSVPQHGYRLHPYLTWQICRTGLRPHTSTDSRHTADPSLASRGSVLLISRSFLLSLSRTAPRRKLGVDVNFITNWSLTLTLKDIRVGIQIGKDYDDFLPALPSKLFILLTTYVL